MSTPNRSSSPPDPRESLQHLIDRLQNGEDPAQLVRDAYVRGAADTMAFFEYSRKETKRERVKRKPLRAFDPNKSEQMQKLLIAVSVFVLAGLAFAHVLNFLFASR